MGQLALQVQLELQGQTVSMVQSVRQVQLETQGLRAQLVPQGQMGQTA